MDDVLTITETARRLGVSRHKVWTLVKDGTLPARQNPLDRREKLVPLDAVEELAARGKAPARPYPRTIGLVSDPTFRSEEAEEYMRAHRERGSVGE
jgi:excisionase family DNA binding protein